MSPNRVEYLFRSYLFVTLIGAIFLSPAPYAAVALLLMLSFAATRRWPLPPIGSLGRLLFALLIIPLSLEEVVGAFPATGLLLPALPLLQWELKRLASHQPLSKFHVGLRATPFSKRLAAALLGVLVFSVATATTALMLTAGLLLGYTLVLFAYVVFNARRLKVAATIGSLRLQVGESRLAEVTFSSTLPWRSGLSLAYPWASVRPNQLDRGWEEEQVELSVRPPLAGPDKLSLQVMAVDPSGLVENGYLVEVLELLVIPRARYAAWLAKKYLEETSPGPVAPMVATVAHDSPFKVWPGGTDFYGERPYYPGDRLRDIDWKRTLKFQELVVKEYSQALGQVVVIAVDLMAENAEEADRLVHDLVLACVTLGRMGVPIALAAYDRQGVQMVTPPLDSREAVKRALALEQRMVIVPRKERFLQAVDPRQLRLTMRQLDPVAGGPAQRLREILGLEYQALQQSAVQDPGYLALTQVARSVPAPAMVLPISRDSYHDEALALARHQLESRGYRYLSLAATKRFRTWARV